MYFLHVVTADLWSSITAVTDRRANWLADVLSKQSHDVSYSISLVNEFYVFLDVLSTYDVNATLNIPRSQLFSLRRHADCGCCVEWSGQGNVHFELISGFSVSVYTART